MAQRRKDKRGKLLATAHIAAKELGLLRESDDEAYRNFIAVRFSGRRSCSELADFEVERLVEHFREVGWKPAGSRQRAAGRFYQERLAYWRKEFPHHRAGYASAKQLAHIEARWKNVNRGGALRKFLFKYFKVEDIRFLKANTAYKVIEGLKGMERGRLPSPRRRATDGAIYD